MRLPLLLLLSLLSATPAFAAGASALTGHPSPYLAAHAKAPVHWRLWGPEVLRDAKDQGKLILVSSGFFACRWAEVMHKESFANPQIAEFIDAHFIPVLADRELSPVLDGYLSDFVRHTRGAAGWPLNVFLTPEGSPLVGTVYLPPAQFMTLLQQLQERWQKHGAELEQVARRAARAADGTESAAPLPAARLVPRLRQALLAASFDRADELAGGFGDQGKFPSAPQLDALLRLHAERPDPRLGAFLRLTLDQMAGQGLRDHLGGGFFRYSADPTWQEPRFEKMLFVNAQLASLYLRAARVFGEAHYREVGLETVDFLLRELAHPDGGFIAGLAAVDGDGVDGGYYLWDRSTVQSLLGDKAYRLAAAVWGLGAEPLRPEGDLPVPQVPMAVVAGVLGTDVATAREQVQGIRQKLLAARAKRDLPRDGLRIAAWNGLALSALAAAAEAAPEPRYRQAGDRLYGYLTDVLWRDGVLARARDHQGRAVAAGTLADYAYVARGLEDWAAVAGIGDGVAQSVVQAAWRRFHTAGGWRPAAAAGLIGPARALLPDGATPSPSAVLALASLRLASPTSDAAPAAAHVVPAAVLAHPFRFASYLTVVQEAAQIGPVNKAKTPPR